MKKNTFLIFIVLVSINKLFGQSTIQIKVPQVKENNQVDSLINRIVKKIDSDNYFINISISSRLNDNEFWVTAVTNKFPIIDLFGINKTSEGHNILLYNDRLRYFVYKGRIVFINGDVECCNLFKKSLHSHSFVFVKHDYKPTLNLMYRYIFTESYTYINNQFSESSFSTK